MATKLLGKPVTVVCAKDYGEAMQSVCTLTWSLPPTIVALFVQDGATQYADSVTTA